MWLVDDCQWIRLDDALDSGQPTDDSRACLPDLRSSRSGLRI